MKRLLAVCLVVYFVSEVIAKPSPQTIDGATDFFEKVKARVQEALDQAREAATRAIEAGRTALQNTFNSVQEVAQSKLAPGEQSQNETEIVEENGGLE